jgi:CspA family cold shock protein
MQKTGRVEFYTPNRGFGFIKPDDGSSDLFFHVGAVVEGVELMAGQRVKYVVERPSRRRDGTIEARDVLLV